MKKCPVPHERQDLEKCLWCGEKIGLSYDEKLKIEVDKVPYDKKQKALDLFHSGKSIGEVCEALCLKTMIVGHILLENIENVGYKKLRKKAI